MTISARRCSPTRRLPRQHAASTLSRSPRRGVIVDVAELDADPLLLNTPNGTINLRTGQLRRMSAAT